MKLFSRLLTLFLAVTVLVLCVNLAPNANAETFGQLEYKVTDDGVIITGSDANISGDFSVPASIAGHAVIAINSKAFYDRDQLTSISIPKSITKIGDSAFSNCDNLEEISVSKDNAKYSSDEQGVLYNKKKTLIQQVPGKLTAYTFPTSVTAIANYAFMGSDLETITIPKKVDSLGVAVFANCASLSAIHVEKDNRAYCSDEQGILYNKSQNLLLQAPGKLSSCTSPDKVNTIGVYSFSFMQNMEALTIPANVTAINAGAFGDCVGLKTLTIEPGLQTVHGDAFYGCTGLTELNLPDTVQTIGNYAFGECTALTQVILGKGVKTVGEQAFVSCTGLNTLVFRGDAPQIHETAFQKVTAKAYYPKDNDTWTQKNLLNYGGELTWRKGDPTDMTGDLNADGEINNEDVAYLLWHTLFTEDYPISSNVDYTADGQVNNEDVAYLLWHTLFPEDYPI